MNALLKIILTQLWQNEAVRAEIVAELVKVVMSNVTLTPLEQKAMGNMILSLLGGKDLGPAWEKFKYVLPKLLTALAVVINEKLPQPPPE